MQKQLAALLLIVATMTASAQQEVKVRPQPKVLASMPSGENGRYVFGQVSDFRADQYMLDTKTGRLWKLTLRSNDKQQQFEVLQDVYYVRMDGGLQFEPPSPPADQSSGQRNPPPSR